MLQSFAPENFKPSTNLFQCAISEESCIHHLSRFVIMSCPMARPKRIGKTYVWLESPGGELQITMGPHWPGVLVVILIICGGTWMTRSIIKSLPAASTLQVLIFEASTAFFFSTTIATLLLTACSDPGIVRVSPISATDEIEDDLSNSPYCETCSIYQSEKLDIKHCYECDVCIMGLDHHCPWMGKCIGKKNMK